AQQALVVQQAEWQLEHARLHLLEQERRAAAIRKLLEKRAAEQALAAQRREQKHTDEQASRLAWNQRLESTGVFAAADI
ncbi:flagellar export protein FliJ, partial [Escherichia coli]|nr:flagellar export protein FliJ [Escherichia coli]